eukprot:62177_1
MALPLPCFGINNKNKKKDKDNKKDTKTQLNTHSALKRQYNKYTQYDDNIKTLNDKIDRNYFENNANWNFITDSSSYGRQENMNMLHGSLYHVIKKCKQMNGMWNCYCQALDKVVFKCNTNANQI